MLNLSANSKWFLQRFTLFLLVLAILSLALFKISIKQVKQAELAQLQPSRNLKKRSGKKKAPSQKKAQRQVKTNSFHYKVKIPGENKKKQRDKAILKGLRWMHRFLQKRWNATDLGLDSVYIFSELAINTRNSLIRKESHKIAKALAIRMKKYLLQPKKLKQASDVLLALDLLNHAKVLGFSPQPLLGIAANKFKEYNTPSKIYEFDFKKLKNANHDQLYSLLIDSFILERAAVSFPKMFKVQFTLYDVLAKIQTVPYTNYKKNDFNKFEDSMFLATHVVFVASNYGRTRLRPKDFPKIYQYLKYNFKAVLQSKDIELIGEFIDVFRAMGFNETNHALTQIGTAYILSTQNPDGSWGKWKKEKNPYDAIHYTWCAVLGLRGRSFLKKTAYAKRLSNMMRKLEKLRRLGKKRRQKKQRNK